MNKINPRKLLNSKWTAVSPVWQEKHFFISTVKLDEKGGVLDCVIEAVISKRQESIDWKALKNSDEWLQGWK